MFKFIKNYFIFLVTVLFLSFYFSYVITLGYQIYMTHQTMIAGKAFKPIEFGLITFVITAFIPLMLWKMVADSEVPLLKETLGIRFILSIMALSFTISLFISKSIFNSVAIPIINFESSSVLGHNGRVVLVEILSLAIPFIIFLYLTKTFVSFFAKKSEE